MRDKIIRYVTLVGAVVTIALGLTAGLSGAAHATTADCKAAHGNHCGTFSGLDSASHVVYWDDKGQVRSTAAIIIGYSANSTADPATDFTLVQHIGHVTGVGLSDQNTKSYSFVYTPRGSWSNLCISDPNDGRGLGLRVCNGGPYQRFFADRNPTTGGAKQIDPSGSGFNGEAIYPGSDYALQNAASRQFVTDAAPVLPTVGTDARQLVTSTVATSAAFGVNQKWTWLP
jgi:hypothetical protein